ncbi:MAG: hypothetical protein WBW71_02670 [Bacteroidota bacterium]
MSAKLSKAEFHQKLGEIVVKFGELEHWLENFIWEILCTDWGSELCVTAGLSMMELADLFCSLYMYRIEDAVSTFPELQERCKKLYGHIQDINRDRNEYLHSRYTVDQLLSGELHSERRKLAKRGGVLKIFFQTHPFDDLAKYSSEITKTRFELIKLMNDSRTILHEHRLKNLNRDYMQTIPPNEKHEKNKTPKSKSVKSLSSLK